MTSPIETNNVVDRLREEADLCRNDGADDIAALLEEAADRIDVLEGAVEKAAIIFEEYDRLHRAKGTLEGDAKAYRNAGYAEELRASLTQGGKNA